MPSMYMSLSEDHWAHRTVLAPLESNFEVDSISHHRESIAL